MSKVFVDTNVLVYAWDEKDKRRRTISRRLLTDLALQGNAVISTQVLLEFFRVTTGKMGLPADVVQRVVREYENFEVIHTDAKLVNQAIDLFQQYSLSIWDAAIVAAASSANCSKLLSEDFQSGAMIDEVEVVNPFDA